MIVTTTETIPGFRRAKTLGQVFGVVVRTLDLQTIRNLDTSMLVSHCVSPVPSISVTSRLTAGVDQPARRFDERVGVANNVRGLLVGEHRALRIIRVLAIALQTRDETAHGGRELAGAHVVLSDQRDDRLV